MTEGWQRRARALARVARTSYPRFAFGLAPRRGEVPIFVFHDVTSDDFRADLTFLAENGYRTIGLSGLAEDPPPKSVVLTFDDARASFLEVALPLLEEFEARAALFVPTAWVGCRVEPPARPVRFLDWDELRICDASPLVDLESHAHRHAMVPVAPAVADFASPSTLARFDVFDWPLRWDSGGKEVLGPPPLGTPVFRSSPLLSESRCFRPPAGLETACRAAAETPGFFARPDWRKTLGGVVEAALTGGESAEPVEGAAYERLRASEFQRSRETFVRELGRVPRHLAYPWCAGTPESISDAARAGYEVVYGVALDVRSARTRPAGAHPRLFARWKCDWLRSLPGNGRRSVREMLVRKVRDWSQTEHLAH